jgi:hypothetical protein
LPQRGRRGLSQRPEFAALLLKAGASADFDAGAPPSPRAMSKTKDPAMQALLATAPAAR